MLSIRYNRIIPPERASIAALGKGPGDPCRILLRTRPTQTALNKSIPFIPLYGYAHVHVRFVHQCYLLSEPRDMSGLRSITYRPIPPRGGTIVTIWQSLLSGPFAMSVILYALLQVINPPLNFLSCRQGSSRARRKMPIAPNVTSAPSTSAQGRPSRAAAQRADRADRACRARRAAAQTETGSARLPVVPLPQDEMRRWTASVPHLPPAQQAVRVQR